MAKPKKKAAKKKTAKKKAPAKPRPPKGPPGSVPLHSAKQERFVHEYLVDQNGAGAARRAGYAEASARQQASDMLADKKIAERLAFLKAQQLERLRLDSDTILLMLSQMAQADISHAYNEDGSMKELHEMPMDIRMCIEQVESKQIEIGESNIGQIIKLKMASRHRSLELAGKHVDIQAFRERVKLEGPTLAELLAGDSE